MRVPTNDAPIGESSETNTNVESSPTEINPQEQAALDSLVPQKDKSEKTEPKEPTVTNQGDKEENEDEDSDEWDGKTPLHKLPRFRKMNAKLKAEREAREKLEKELEGYRQTGKTETADDESKGQDSKNYGVDYEAIDRVFENVPEFDFKDDYATVSDMFKDFRRAIMGELMYVRETHREAQEMSRSEEVQNYESRISQILEDIGDEDQAAQFIEYAQSYVQEFSEMTPVTGDVLTDAYVSFLRDMGVTPSKVQTKKTPVPSKINKSIKSSTPKVKGPSKDYLRSKSLDDILADQLGIK